jgi:hypothetical protein
MMKTTMERDPFTGMLHVTQTRKISGLTTIDTMDITPSDFVKMTKTLVAGDMEMRIALGLSDAEEIAHARTNGLVR